MNIHSANTPASMCQRPMLSQTHPHWEAKSNYLSTWRSPSSAWHQSSLSVPNATSANVSGGYGQKSSQGLGAHYRTDVSHWPCLHTASSRASTWNEATSLHMASFYRHHTRQNSFAEGTAPQQQLPFSAPQSTQNVVNQLQEQRLRSTQAMGTSTTTTGGAWFKPLPARGTDNGSWSSTSTVTVSEMSA